jgi:cellulose biosynthesis protein BcsQ
LVAEFDDVVAGLDLAVPAELVHRSIVVAGPPGAGQTEIAIALATSLSRAGRTILVDLDEHRPGIASRLQRGLSPNVLNAIDGMRSGTLDGSDPVLSALAVAQVAGGHLPFHVLCGIADRRDWVYLRAQDIEALIEALVDGWKHVVLNAGPELEDLTRWIDRSPASRTVMANADEIVAVCEPSPRGLLRLFDWMVELHELRPDARCTLVVNRTPRSGFVKAELEDQIRRSGGPAIGQIVWVPDDRRVSRAAWDGTLVARGPFTRAVDELAASLLAGAGTGDVAASSLASARRKLVRSRAR